MWMYGSQWGSLAAAQNLYKAVLFTTSHARIRISTTSHARICIRYYKSHALIWTCNEMKGSYDRIIIIIIPSYTGKSITRLLPLAMLLVLHTRNNRRQQLVIFSSIALYLWWYLYNIILQRYCSNDGLENNCQMQISNSVFSGLIPEMFTNSFLLYVPLTSVCFIHSNVYGLCDIPCIRYLTTVDPFLSTSTTV